MKKILLTCLLLIISNITTTAQSTGTPDTFNTNLPDTPNKVIVKNLSQLDKEIKALTDTVRNKLVAVPVISPCVNCEPGVMGYVLIMLPVGLFLVLVFYFLRWLKREKFKLSDALSSDNSNNEFSTTSTSANDPADPTRTVTVTTSEPNYSKSSSRLIAFLTAIAAIVIALYMITLYAYSYITKSGEIPKIDELWKIIAGLGIGVVPYVSKVIKEAPKA